mmetsp:Transcript_9451/g.15287  ORF Transcript_9451/g.15287 Transcript_9451/m.15287 type:complete len:341 (-) Transcript_9451:112-1134(-)
MSTPSASYWSSRLHRVFAAIAVSLLIHSWYHIKLQWPDTIIHPDTKFEEANSMLSAHWKWSQRRKWQDHEAPLYPKCPKFWDKDMEEKGEVGEEHLSAEMKENIARWKENKYDARGRLRTGNKVRHPRRHLGDKEAEAEERVEAEKALNEGDYDTAVMHYRLAIVHNPHSLDSRLDLLTTLQKLPDRNFTQELEDGNEALQWVYKLGQHGKADIEKMLSILHLHAEGICNRIIREQNATAFATVIGYLNNVQSLAGKTIAGLSDIQEKHVDLTKATKMREREARGEVIDDAEDADDEDEVEIGWQKMHSEWRIPKEKMRKWATDTTENLLPLPSVPLMIA